MHQPAFRDFDVLIEGVSEGEYRARVVNAPTGSVGWVRFEPPATQDDLEQFLMRMGRRRNPVRRTDVPESAVVKDFGGRLYEALFRDDLELALLRSQSEARTQGAGLRVRLRLSDAPELADFPWEFLYDRQRDRFLALSEKTPLVRYLELPDPPRPFPVHPPLRVLVMIAGPAGVQPLDVEREWGTIHEALDPLSQAGQVVIERLASGSVGALQRRLRQGDVHVLHFIGHGGFDPASREGFLLLEDPSGRARAFPAQDLALLLQDHDPLRLVVLNACEGARNDITDPFAGTAQTLIRQGTPAVVAMQFEVTDRAAITLSRELYTAVADGYPLDAALTAARKALRLDGNLFEWGTPVLYLAAPDGRIFEPDSGAEPGVDRRRTEPPAGPEREAEGPVSGAAGPEPAADPEYSAALAAYYSGRWDEALELLTRLSARYPEHQQTQERLARARHRQAIEHLEIQAAKAEAANDWQSAVGLLEELRALAPDDPAAGSRLDVARAKQKVAALRADIAAMHAARQWDAVLALGRELAQLEPDAADPDGMVTTARESLERRAVEERYISAVRAVDNGDWRTAAQVLTQLERDSPGYRQAAELLASVRMHLDEKSPSGIAEPAPEHEIAAGTREESGAVPSQPGVVSPPREPKDRERGLPTIPYALIANAIVVSGAFIVLVAPFGLWESWPFAVILGIFLTTGIFRIRVARVTAALPPVLRWLNAVLGALTIAAALLFASAAAEVEPIEVLSAGGLALVLGGISDLIAARLRARAGSTASGYVLGSISIAAGLIFFLLPNALELEALVIGFVTVAPTVVNILTCVVYPRNPRKR